VSFVRVSLQIWSLFRHLAAVPAKFYTWSKTATTAVFPTPAPIGRPLVRNGAIFGKFEVKGICADDWAIVS